MLRPEVSWDPNISPTSSRRVNLFMYLRFPPIEIVEEIQTRQSLPVTRPANKVRLLLRLVVAWSLSQTWEQAAIGVRGLNILVLKLDRFNVEYLPTTFLRTILWKTFSLSPCRRRDH